MTSNPNESLAAEIAERLKAIFGIDATDASPIDKGWLNVKWRMETDQGPLFVKYYHPERYKLHVRRDRRNEIEHTLRLQNGMSLSEIPCPRVRFYNEQTIQETPSGHLFTAMDWVDGYCAPAGRMNVAQMRELGLATGRMHRWLQGVKPSDKLAWKPDKQAYMREWQTNRQTAQEAGDRTVLEWLERSGKLVKEMDFGVFEASPTGWLHWDLWTDNLLLRDQGLAGIVDFDRMATAYPEIDAARAVLSGALRDGRMRPDAVQAFMEGYREHSDAPRGMLSRAFRMLYVIESLWWFRTEVRAESELRGLLARFIEELHWIENNLSTLREQLDG